MTGRMLIVIALNAALWANGARADYAAGIEAYKNKDYATALVQLRPEAQQGNRIAQNLVGVMHMNGLGMSPDDAEAAKWYRMAAEQGYAVAQTNLGYLYEHGRGLEQSLSEARKWYEKAALQGDPRAGTFLKQLARKEEVQRQALNSMAAPSPPPAGVNPAPAAAESDKAAQLAHLVLVAVDQTDNSKILATIAARGLDNPQRWNDRSPDWNSIVDLIRLDIEAINRKFGPRRIEAQQAREKALAAYYARFISGSQLDELLNYYASGEGRRCQAFMQEIATVTVRAVSELTGNMLVSGIGDSADTPQLSAQEQSRISHSAEERLRVLRLSRSYRIQLARGDPKIAVVAGTVVGAVAARRGEAVDRVNQKYAADVAAFEKFVNSTAAQSEIAGLSKLSTVVVPAEKKLKNDYLAEIASYRVKWRQLYVTQVKPVPASAAGSRI